MNKNDFKQVKLIKDTLKYNNIYDFNLNFIFMQTFTDLFSILNRVV